MDKDEALKLALEALEKHGEAPKDWACKECVPFSDILEDGFQCKYHKAITAIKQALAAQPAPVQPVACAVCNEVHAILDADDSKIIRDAKDGYPDGRTPRTLTLQERVTALCVYASDWKRWCLEKENTTPSEAPVQEPVAWRWVNPKGWLTYGEAPHDTFKSTPLYTAPPAERPAIPDALTSADIEEHIEYVAGWNECRQAMMEMMK